MYGEVEKKNCFFNFLDMMIEIREKKNFRKKKKEIFFEKYNVDYLEFV